jgi:diguanylate cyclase (GGDEF)-like protein
MNGTETEARAMTAEPRQPAARRLFPFLGVGALGVAVIVASRSVDGSQTAVALAMGALATALVVWVPWGRLPSTAGAIPALLFIAALAVFRDAAGGATAGMGPLFLLPVLWLGLYGSRTQLGIVVPAVGLAFFVPIVVEGAPTYPSAQWGVGIVYVATSLLIGLAVEQLIGRIQLQADQASRREMEIARVADLARRLSSGEGTRRDVCAAACEIGDSAFALLWESEGDGRLAVTASAGVSVPRLVIDPSHERAATLTAFRTGTPIFVPDVNAEHSINARLLEVVGGAVSILFQPVLRHGEPVGVLVVGWAVRIDEAEHRIRVLVGLLAAEAGIAIERADLLTKLEELADTDELTGLPNRRAWNRELEVAISTAQRRQSSLCVALIDVDRFKKLNDERGHQAGDRLLKAASAAWRSALRPADVLARPGGDEFALVLPDCDIHRAGVVLGRLRSATPSGSTVSIGVAEWDGAESSEHLIQRVDEALYAAKEGGRDRIVPAADD